MPAGEACSSPSRRSSRTPGSLRSSRSCVRLPTPPLGCLPLLLQRPPLRILRLAPVHIALQRLQPVRLGLGHHLPRLQVRLRLRHLLAVTENRIGTFGNTFEPGLYLQWFLYSL